MTQTGVPGDSPDPPQGRRRRAATVGPNLRRAGGGRSDATDATDRWTARGRPAEAPGYGRTRRASRGKVNVPATSSITLTWQT
jgi:hypothetical protein